jgi:hypothetical protein
MNGVNLLDLMSIKTCLVGCCPTFCFCCCCCNGPQTDAGPDPALINFKNFTLCTDFVYVGS